MQYHFKSILFICCILFIACSNGEVKTVEKVIPTNEVVWMSIEEAEAETLKNPKPIFVMVHAHWCPHCKNFDKTTYKNQKVIHDLNTKYYPVKMNAHDNRTIHYRSTDYSNPNFDESKSVNDVNSYHEILYEIQAKSIPSIVFIGKDFEIKGTELGYKEPDELRSLLAMYQN